MARASVIQDYSESLLYAMCALSARYTSHSSTLSCSNLSRCIYLDSLHASSEPNHEPGPVPGDVWAEKARKMVFDEIHLPTIHQIMVRRKSAIGDNDLTYIDHDSSLRVWAEE